MNTNMKIIITMMVIIGTASNVSAFGWWEPPEPVCYYWWCAPIPEPEPEPTPIPTPEPTPIPLPVVVPDPVEPTPMPDCPEIQCKDPRIKPTPEVPPNPKCIHWWCNPEIPNQSNNSVTIQTTPTSTSISPLFIFGSSDVDRYNTFKAQLNDSELSARAKYYMDGILLEYELNQTEFENKYIN